MKRKLLKNQRKPNKISAADKKLLIELKARMIMPLIRKANFYKYEIRNAKKKVKDSEEMLGYYNRDIKKLKRDFKKLNSGELNIVEWLAKENFKDNMYLEPTPP